MQDQTWFETIKVQGGQLVDQVKHLIDDASVTRIKIRQDEQVVVEFPLAVGVVGTLLAPTLAAVGVLAALLTNCSIVVERRGKPPEDTTSSSADAAPRTESDEVPPVS